MSVRWIRQEEAVLLKRTWLDIAKDFYVQSADGATVQRKLNRAKVYQWLITTWHMLMCATGKGWSAFVQPADKTLRGPLASWGSVTLAIDQGADGWSAAQYLMSTGVNLLLIGDPSHRIWNDVKLALQSAGLLQWSLIVAIIFKCSQRVVACSFC